MIEQGRKEGKVISIKGEDTKHQRIQSLNTEINRVSRTQQRSASIKDTLNNDWGNPNKNLNKIKNTPKSTTQITSTHKENYQ